MTAHDRTGWLAARQTTSIKRRWHSREIEQLESLVGHATLNQMAAQLERPINSIASKLSQLGYLISKDVHGPLGLSAVGLARRLQVPYEAIYRRVRSGHIPAQRLRQNKDYLIDWPDVRRAERHFARLHQRRAQALARITEPTITKQAFMALIGLAETHAMRYLQGRIVRAWKIPCHWVEADRARWEWAVSKKDAERVKLERETGQLRLNTPAYRALQRHTNTEIAVLRRERRLGQRPPRGPRQCVIPGALSVPQVAHQVGLSDAQVYSHIQLGRLPAERVQVGKRSFSVVRPEALPAYLDWCAREVKATGPLHPRQAQIQAVNRAGRLTLTQAAARYGIKRGTLARAVNRGQVPSETIAGIFALRARDVRHYATQAKRHAR